MSDNSNHTIVLKSVFVLDPDLPTPSATKDIRISGNIISEIDTNLVGAEKVGIKSFSYSSRDKIVAFATVSHSNIGGDFIRIDGKRKKLGYFTKFKRTSTVRLKPSYY